MGHFSVSQVKMATMSLAAAQMELSRLKRAPVSAEAYLDVLNRFVEVSAKYRQKN